MTARRRALAGHEQRADAAEVQLRAGGGRQVELAPADVRAAIDHADADHAVAAAQGHPRAARQRLVRDAERAGRQAPAARQLVAVQPGAIPRDRGTAVDVEPADLAPRGVDDDAQAGAPALLRAKDEPEAAAGARR